MKNWAPSAAKSSREIAAGAEASMIERLRDFTFSTRSLALVALVFTLFQVSWSFRTHRLAQEPNSDDNEYLWDAMLRLDMLDQHGPIPFVEQFFSNPPHSPFATAVCLIGLAFGINGFVGPYLVNGFLIFILLREVDRLASGLSLTAKAILLAGILLLPLTRLTVVELRPDFAVGLFGAMACLRLCRMILLPGTPTSADIFSCALWQALTLLAKPTYFAHSLIIFGMSIALSLLFQAAVDRHPTEPRLITLLNRARPCAWSVGWAVALCSPYYIFGFRDIWDYIRSNVWGSNAAFWRIPGGISESFQYFLSGPGSSPIGNFLQLFLFIILVGIAYLLWLRRLSEAAEIMVGLLVALASATIIVIGRIGNPTFNVPADFLLTLTAVTGLTYLLKKLRASSIQLVAVLPILILGLIQPPILGNMNRYRLADTGIADKIVNSIESLDSGEPDFTTRTRKLALLGGSPFNGYEFDILAHNRHFPLEADDLSDWLNLDTVMGNLGDPDFVCVTEPGADPKVYHDLDAALLERFKSDHRFRFVSRFPMSRGAVWLFQRNRMVSSSCISPEGK
jgi:hypothetical protein